MVGTEATLGKGLTPFGVIAFEIAIVEVNIISMVGLNPHAVRRDHPLIGLCRLQGNKADGAGKKMIVKVFEIMV